MGSTLTVLDVVVGNRDPVKNAKWLKKEQEEEEEEEEVKLMGRFFNQW